MKVFVDIYLMFNFGDDLFLDILAKKYPNCEFTINYLGKKYDHFISQYQNVFKRKYTLFNKIGQKLKITDSITNFNDIAEEHDALLFLGGSIFREEEYHKSLYAERLKIVQEFNKRNKPIFILGANFGPFKTEKFINDYKELFYLCKDVCFRDKYSYNLFKDIPQVRYAPDIIFQLDVNEYINFQNKKRIGFSIIDVRHKQGLSKFYDEYIGSTVKAIELLTQIGYECYLMSFCEHEGDLNTIRSIKAQLSKNAYQKVTTYEYKGKLKEAISLIASFNLFIAARFHANILAIILEIGVLPIVYSSKTTNMLKDVEHDEVYIVMEKLNLQYDLNLLKKAFNNKKSIHSVVLDSEDQFKVFNEFLNTTSLAVEDI